MIKNERQYRITKAQAQKFMQALAQMQDAPEENPGLHPVLRQAEQDAIQSQWESLQSEINDYEALLTGKQQSFQLASFDELPRP